MTVFPTSVFGVKFLNDCVFPDHCLLVPFLKRVSNDILRLQNPSLNNTQIKEGENNYVSEYL